jgi:hypothetical protein
VHKFGDQLFVKSTDEPSFVVHQFKYFTLVRRPVMGQDGIRYKFGIFFNSELETLAEQTQRTLATIKARNQIAELEMQDAVEATGGPFMPQMAFKKPS